MNAASEVVEDRLRSVLAAKAAEVDRRPLPPLEVEVLMTLEPVEPVPVRAGWRRWSAVGAVTAAALVVVAVVLLAIPPTTSTPPASGPTEPGGSTSTVPAGPVVVTAVPIPDGCAGNWGILLTRGPDILELIGVSTAPVLSSAVQFETAAGSVAVTESGAASIVYLTLSDGSAIGFTSATLSPSELVAVTESVAPLPAAGGVGADEVQIPLPVGFRVENAACGVG